MDNSSAPDVPSASPSRFWVGPLVAGCCFALGYGITHRVLTLQTRAQDPIPEPFTPLAFPGESLQEIRARFSDNEASLQVDVAALEAAEAVNRPAKPVVKTESKPALALQTPSSPEWTVPAWSDPQAVDTEVPLELPGAEGPAPSTAEDSAATEDEPLVLQEPSEMAPADGVLGEDSPVLVAEPEPIFMPPGAEAFFEAVEPVNPPQP